MSLIPPFWGRYAENISFRPARDRGNRLGAHRLQPIGERADRQCACRTGGPGPRLRRFLERVNRDQSPRNDAGRNRRPSPMGIGWKLWHPASTSASIPSWWSSIKPRAEPIPPDTESRSSGTMTIGPREIWTPGSRGRTRPAPTSPSALSRAAMASRGAKKNLLGRSSMAQRRFASVPKACTSPQMRHARAGVYLGYFEGDCRQPSYSQNACDFKLEYLSDNL
jgi:hypothetical protein